MNEIERKMKEVINGRATISGKFNKIDKTSIWYALQCYCPPTGNFEPLYGCEYATKDEALEVYNRMLDEGRATGIRVVEVKPGYRRTKAVATGPLPKEYFEYRDGFNGVKIYGGEL